MENHASNTLSYIRSLLNHCYMHRFNNTALYVSFHSSWEKCISLNYKDWCKCKKYTLLTTHDYVLIEGLNDVLVTAVGFL